MRAWRARSLSKPAAWRPRCRTRPRRHALKTRSRAPPQVGDLERELGRYRKMDSEGKKGSGIWGYISGSTNS